MIGVTGVRGEDGLLDDVLVRLIDDPTTGGVVAVLGLVAAIAVGSVHALGPGHGKALIGAYLVGSRGRARDAVALGVLVAAMHSGSVLLLAFAFQTTQQLAGTQRLETLLAVVAALGVTAVGCWMVVDRWRKRGRGHGHGEHGHGGHEHHHHHDLPEGVAPLSWAGILALAGAGGLIPSPVAFLVLMTALALGRTGYGIALIFAFSVGLAVTLTAIGLAVLWGRDRLRRHAHRPRISWLVARLSLAGAVAVLAGGLLLSWGAVASL